VKETRTHLAKTPGEVGATVASGSAAEPQIILTYFTHPYCSWCWATEPIILRLRETYRSQIRLRYVMGSLETKAKHR
jgi:hypothetical protein